MLREKKLVKCRIFCSSCSLAAGEPEWAVQGDRRRPLAGGRSAAEQQLEGITGAVSDGVQGRLGRRGKLNNRGERRRTHQRAEGEEKEALNIFSAGASIVYVMLV